LGCGAQEALRKPASIKLRLMMACRRDGAGETGLFMVMSIVGEKIEPVIGDAV